MCWNSYDSENRLFINENIPYTLRKDITLAESVFIEVEKGTSKKTKNIILGVIYRSPESSLTDFNDNLENLLIKIDRENKYSFRSGDYNVNTLHELSCHASATQDFINILSSFDYHKLINMPTRVVMACCTIKSATLIDNIYTNINYWNDGIRGVLHSDDSIGIDHTIIFSIRINSELPKYNKYRKQRYLSLKNIQ